MILYYLKLAFRSIFRHKGYSFITILGFAVGIACALLILVYVADELSYDRFYPHGERIYRVAHHAVLNERVDHTARSSPPLARALAEQFPEVEAVTRCRNYGFPVFRYGDKVFSEERVFAVDPAFFEVFRIPFIRGAAESALARPDGLVLTRSMAEKYFGGEDPIGKTINADRRRDFIVTAVVEDVPANSHFHFDFLRSLAPYNDARGTVWVFNDFYTYVLLREGTDPKALEAKLFAVVKDGIDPFLRSVLGISAEQFLAGGGDFRYYFQPLHDIHLRSHLDFELEANGDIVYVYIFSAIALGILLIACINFINLATARSALRAREVGVRKTLGSARFQIMRQFLVETVLLTLQAVGLAWLLAELSRPLFNTIAGKNLTLPFLSHWWGIPLLLGFALLIGVLAGFYPAFFLASFRPVQVLKGGAFLGAGRQALRTGLVVLQFTLSAILIIAALTVREQLRYIRNSDLGFDKDRVVVIHKADDLGSDLAAFKAALLEHHGVLSAANSVDLPGQPIEIGALTPEGQSDDQARMVCYMMVDPDFLQTYGITLTAGRFFEAGRPADASAMVLNRTAVQAMGLTDPLGQILLNSLFTEQRYPVLGVVEDFHFQSLRQRIQPLVFFRFPENQVGRYLSVKIRGEHIPETLGYLEETWQKFAGGQAFEYEFFDAHFQRIYLAEQRTGRIFLIFTVLAVIIACLGLFGLSAFITERRTREVGIRKAFGASTGRVISLLAGQFLKWVMIANLIAWPLAWIAMQRWLQGFAYRAAMSAWIFIAAAGLALLIALLTVSWQVFRAARANPVETLRYE